VNASPDETPEVEETLEETLRSAFAAANEETPADPEPQAETPSEEAEAPSGRERDEHGRFKAKTDEAPVEADQAAAPATADQAGDADAVRPDPYGLAPTYTKAAIKEKWGELPVEVRQAIVEREREAHQAVTRFDEDRNFGKQMKGIVQPFENLIRSLGAEPAQAITYLLKGDATLRTGTPEQKRQMFLKLAQDYGVQFDPSQPVPQPAPIDPNVETALQRIARLEMELNNASKAARETEESQIEQSIEAFAADPAHAYFENVRQEMSVLLQNGLAGSLQEAYDKAVWANPETRALHLTAQREAEDRKRTAEAAERARAARRASPSVTGAPGSAVPPPANGSSNSVEDDVRAALMLHAGRA
jgi:hypothetical protein